MYGVIRTYSGSHANDLFDLIVDRKDEVEQLIRGVDGFISYTLVQTDDGGATVTVCKDKEGCDESIQIAHDWIVENADELHTEPPHVTEAPAKIYFTA